MPIGNGFLSKTQFDNEYFFELEVGFCSTCYMVQLVTQPDREKMFHENYAFFSSTSSRMIEHFKKFADFVTQQYLQEQDPLVIEIGCNDGILIQNFAKKRIRHLGVEPSKNVAKVANNNGVETISEFFDENLAEKIIKKYSHADVILAANVMCHIPYLHSVVSGIKKLLKPEGVFIFEDPYLGDIVEKVSYDQIYDEHAFYFSLASIRYLFELHNLEIIDVMPQQVHGGSMRYVIAHKGKKTVSPAVIEHTQKEIKLGLQNPETFQILKQNIEKSRNELKSLLNNLRKDGKRIVGYGATSKSTTVTNYCDITSDLVEFISDTTPIKQGKFNPGTHIPVKDYQVFCNNYPDYALLFAWNHSEEIMAKEDDFIKSGGKWIVYVPEVKVIE
jgi:methylation protein EvaC